MSQLAFRNLKRGRSPFCKFLLKIETSCTEIFFHNIVSSRDTLRYRDTRKTSPYRVMFDRSSVVRAKNASLTGPMVIRPTNRNGLVHRLRFGWGELLSTQVAQNYIILFFVSTRERLRCCTTRVLITSLS